MTHTSERRSSVGDLDCSRHTAKLAVMPAPHPHGTETRSTVLAAAQRHREHRERIADLANDAHERHEKLRSDGRFLPADDDEAEVSE